MPFFSCVNEKSVSLYLIVMWWQLVQQLFDAIFLSRAVNVRDLLFWQGIIILMHLKPTKIKYLSLSMNDTHKLAT